MARRQNVEAVGKLIGYHPEMIGIRDPHFGPNRVITPLGYGFRYGRIIVSETIRGRDRIIPKQIGRVATFNESPGFSVVLDTKIRPVTPWSNETYLSYINTDIRLDDDTLASAVHALANQSDYPLEDFSYGALYSKIAADLASVLQVRHNLSDNLPQ